MRKNKFFNIINSIILCLRFPFLYPRNRFTGMHYNNWKISNFSRTWKPQTYDNIILDYKENDGNYQNIIYSGNNLRQYRVSIFNNKLYICRGNKVVYKKPLPYFGKGKIFGLQFKDENHIYLVVSKDYEKNPDCCRIITITHAKWLNRICRILEWIEEYPLQLFHCIPTYTELDEMPIGWRKAFGIQMCKEIKKALKKNHCLRKYRIVQIKEKFGTLRWYDNGAPKEVYDIINKYEDLSYYTCIHCGKPAEYISRDWISPYCSECVNNPEDYDRIC